MKNNVINITTKRNNGEYNKLKSKANIFSSLCRKSQKSMKKFVTERLENSGYTPVVGDGYVYAEGTVPVLLVAHMDTVHKKLCKTVNYKYDKDSGLFGVESPEGIGGDDRCGIFMIFEVIKELNCSVLFTEDEEIGGVGATKFTQTDIKPNVNYIIEFDRRGSNDAVFYDCDNPEFTDFICDGFYKEKWGSFSDISYVAPHLGVAAVNLSCGYYEAHTTKEYVIINEMLESIEQAKKIIKKECDQPFEYIEAKGYGGYYDGYYGDFAGWDWDYLKGKYAKPTIDNYDSDKIFALEVIFVDPMTCEENIHCTHGHSEVECWGQFFLDNPEVNYLDVLDFYSCEI